MFIIPNHMFRIKQAVAVGSRKAIVPKFLSPPPQTPFSKQSNNKKQQTVGYFSGVDQRPPTWETEKTQDSSLLTRMLSRGILSHSPLPIAIHHLFSFSVFGCVDRPPRSREESETKRASSGVLTSPSANGSSRSGFFKPALP